METVRTRIEEISKTIDQARKGLRDIITEIVEQHGTPNIEYDDVDEANRIVELSPTNCPMIIIDSEDGCENLLLVAVSSEKVYLSDGTNYDIADMETDQIKIVAEYLEMTVNPVV